MAIKVGDAILTVKADMDKVKKDLDTLRKTAGVGLVAAGTAVIGTVGKMVTSYANLGDQLQKMSLRTGISVQSLSEFKHALEINGASLESFENGVKRMSRFVVDAGDGLATNVRVLDALGLKYEDLQGLKPEDQFMLLAKAIGELEDPTLQAAAAQQVFGRAGTQLLPTIKSGAGGIAALRQEAHDLGITMDQEAADKSAQFNDQMHRLGETIKGAGMSITKELLPTITEWVDAAVEAAKGAAKWVAANKELIASFVEWSAKLAPILVALGSMLLLAPKIVAAFQIIKSIATVFEIGFAAITPTGWVILAIAALAAGAAYVIKHWEGIKDFFSDLWDNVVDATRWAGEKIVDFLQTPYKWLCDVLGAAGKWLGIADSVGGPGIGHHAAGGIVRTPLALVGERGPELIAGAQGSKVFSAAETRQMLAAGGGGANISINIDSMNVRDDQDVSKIAEKLYSIINRRLRQRGM